MNTLKYILVIAAGVLLACAAVSTLVSVSQEYSYQKRQVCCTDHRLIYEKLCEINSNLVELVAQPKGDKICLPPVGYPESDSWIHVMTNLPSCIPCDSVLMKGDHGSAASH